jgi:hypothetical protein
MLALHCLGLDDGTEILRKSDISGKHKTERFPSENGHAM